MSNESELGENEEGEIKLGTDENANETLAGSRAPSRAKSRGSIGDDRKTITRKGGRSTAYSENVLSGVDDNDLPLGSRAYSDTTYSENSGFDTDLEDEVRSLMGGRTILGHNSLVPPPHAGYQPGHTQPGFVADVREAYDASGRSTYKEACRLNGVIPVSYFLRHISDAELTMKHHGLGPAGAKAIAISLVTNTTICKLNLSDNWLDAEGGIAIADMLKENCYITDLDLSDNKLGNAGAKAISEMLLQNSTITHLTLTGNGFEDKSAEYFADVILNNGKIEYLNLSHNECSEAAGLVLGPAVSENITIKQIDLSWNHIRRKGALALAKGIMNNIGLKIMNLSWNGFGNEGAQALGEALKMNASLEELDIANNRMSAEGAICLGKGLASNESLKILRVGKNPMQAAGAYAILKAVKDNPNTIMDELDFSGIQVNKEFEDLHNELMETRPNIKTHHGGMKEPVKPKQKLNPMLKLQKYIQKNNLRLVDFFNKFDKDGSMTVTYDEFEEGLVESGIDLSKEEITFMVGELDKDGDGEINYSELLCGTIEGQEKGRQLEEAIKEFKEAVDRSVSN